MTQTIGSLAVLPLENVSNDPEQDYFADGMTEELTTELAQMSQLKVISHTSVVLYKSTKESLPRIARDLGVDAVVEGAVERSGERVGIRVRLIEGASDRQCGRNPMSVIYAMCYSFNARSSHCRRAKCKADVDRKSSLR